MAKKKTILAERVSVLAKLTPDGVQISLRRDTDGSFYQTVIPYTVLEQLTEVKDVEVESND